MTSLKERFILSQARQERLEIMIEACEELHLPTGVWLTLKTLIFHASNDGVVKVSQASLAEEAEVSVSSFQRHLAVLKDRGLISTKMQGWKSVGTITLLPIANASNHQKLP